MANVRLLTFLWFTALKQLTWAVDNEILPEFQAVLGSTANLPCQVPKRPPESGIKCIFWYKDDEVMSVYTVDARDGGTHTLHVPSDKLRSRASFDPSPWPPVLKMVSVKEGDEGVYYCRVDYRWDRTYMYTVVLKVIVPPKKLVILNDHDEEIIGMAGPYLEGQSVKMTCEAIGGKPSPHLSWWRGRVPLKGGSPVSSHGQVRSDYTFIPKRSDVLTFLTCRSVNNNVTEPKTVSVQIDLYLKPLDVVLTPQLMSLTAGRKVEIRCYSGGSRPPSRISWFLDNEPMSNHTDLLSMDGNRTTSILTFWPSRSDHKKYLRCRAENFLLSGSALEDGWHLNVTYVPQVSLTIRSSSKQHSSFLEGDDVRFNCEVKANPMASEVGWLFEGRPLSSEDPELVMSYRSLLIRRVKRKHRGRYQCYANNMEGTGMSRVINLRAMFAPVCRNGLQKTYAVSADDLERIECQVDADPAKVDFKWSFSNTADRHYNVSFTSAGLRSVATYTPRSARDYGTLYCWGKNSVGEQQMPCIFTIIPMGPPETLQNCTSANVTMTSVTIVCVRGPRQDPDLKYNLEMYMYHSHEMVYQTSSTAPYFVVGDLKSATEFLFVVYAVNQNGKSSPVVVRVWTSKTPMDERVFKEKNASGMHQDKSGPGISWIGPGLLIGVALCCLFILIGATAWSKLRGGPGCKKCKEIPKQLQFKKSFSKRVSSSKNYIDRLPEGNDKRDPCI
ncbi:hypothetical protein JTE90_023736 [Oedothorax gibbosus]|uniref:Uncharacterized protein n=1 Tax=Oedothorax gibbosus TaxID=931172 RepID=A0AAV6V9R4_9ARAC|nr:hypothetical protein JTE90_023736 [Oedothorax gibbosus]